MKAGDEVVLHFGDQQIDATVVIASTNQDSIALAFDGIFGGYVGVMPLLRQDGVYRDLMHHQAANIGIRCPHCQRISWNPHDVDERYCGGCHVFFTEDNY